MKKPLKMLAFDLGASSGRAILGKFDGTKLETQELHRFSNDPVKVMGHLHWDILRLFYEIKQGIFKCANGGNRDVVSIGIDTWGVDIGLLDGKGNLQFNPYHYRDSLTDGIMEEVFKIIPQDELYKLTGLQFMKFNTIFQLFAMNNQNPSILKEAKTILMISDLFNYFLTGVKATEYSIASTTQLLDPIKRAWSSEIISRLQLPGDIFPEIIQPGTILGNISLDISEECGVGTIPVIATTSHDTASAVASVPAKEEQFVYISCGTWSLMGVEADQPVINDKSYALSYSNEGGINNKIRFLKMIMGLWLIQECKRQWDWEGRIFSFSELESLALAAEPFKAFIDPDDISFMPPGNMPGRIAKYCGNTGQYVPTNPGEIIRCITQSLALKYRMTVENLEEILGKRLPVIHMVGGGIKNRMLCRFTANATGREVFAGPVEATSIGNLMVQTIALGEVKNLREVRQIIMSSFPVEKYEPQDTGKWDEAYYRFFKIIKK
jgi:rhamnulokinase